MIVLLPLDMQMSYSSSFRAILTGAASGGVIMCRGFVLWQNEHVVTPRKRDFPKMIVYLHNYGVPQIHVSR